VCYFYHLSFIIDTATLPINTCFCGLPDSISIQQTEPVPTGGILVLNNRLTCTGIITHISVGYEVINDTGDGIYFQLRREDDNGNTRLVQSISLLMDVLLMGTGERGVIELSDSIPFLENDIVTVFIPSDSRFGVLVDRSANTSSYLQCREVVLDQDCTFDNLGRTRIMITALLSQSLGSGIPQITITGNLSYHVCMYVYVHITLSYIITLHHFQSVV